MATDDAEIREHITGPLAGAGIVIEDVSVVEAGVHRTLTVVIDLPEDTADPVSIDHIADATRIVSEALDPLPLFKDRPYELEVTSPGADRPLRERRHFRRVVGRTIAVRTADARLRGRLSAVGEDAITVEDEKAKEPVDVPFGDIEHAEAVLKYR